MTEKNSKEPKIKGLKHIYFRIVEGKLVAEYGGDPILRKDRPKTTLKSVKEELEKILMNVLDEKDSYMMLVLNQLAALFLLLQEELKEYDKKKINEDQENDEDVCQKEKNNQRRVHGNDKPL
jgi:hypothetical protein